MEIITTINYENIQLDYKRNKDNKTLQVCI